MIDWRDKVVLVTGGSSGLGRAIAAVWATRGARLVLAARDADRLQAAAEGLRQQGAEVLAVPTDILRGDQVERLIGETVARFDRLDVLVNCAGRSARGELLTTSAEEFRELMDLNFLGAVRATQAALPHLLARRGHVVNIGSLAGKSAARHMGAYSATKFALSAYSQQLRIELGPRGLHVLLVCTGPIARDDDSQSTAARERDKLAHLPASAAKPGAGVKLRAIDPTKLAERIVGACEHGRAELIVPWRAKLLFALSQLSPRWGDWILRKASGD